MAILAWQCLTALLLLTCLGSFAWSMRNFFVQPSGDTAGMRMIRLCGTAFAGLHLALILWPGFVRPGPAAVGAVFYALALGLFWWAIAANRARPLSAVFSPDLPQHLMDHGPYRLIRHPFYGSYLLTWIAGVFATSCLWLLLTVVVMAAIYWHASKIEEEKFSRSALARSYERYRSRTGRFFPNPLKLLTGGPR